MDELGFNKVFAGVLLAGLLLMAGIKAADVLIPHTELAENAYKIEVPEGDVATAAAPADTGPEPILALLADADAVAGEKLSKKCSACHVFATGGPAKVGPALWGIVNASKGAAEGFSYSAALANFGGEWDYEALNASPFADEAEWLGWRKDLAICGGGIVMDGGQHWLRPMRCATFSTFSAAVSELERFRFRAVLLISS